MITIYGASDDLIEVEGDIEEEFTFPNLGEDIAVVLSDGSLIAVDYNDGAWELHPVFVADSYRLTPHKGWDSDQYSDRIEIDGKHTWAALVKVLDRSEAQRW